MSDISSPASTPPAYHLHLNAAERPVLAVALRLLLGDMAHTSVVRAPARRALERVGAEPALVPEQPLTMALDEAELKVVHTALHILFDDLGREDAAERGLIREMLDKLPDEHAIRAIEL